MKFNAWFVKKAMNVIFQVLTVASMQMAVFWVVAPCRPIIALMMEATSTSETSVNFYQTTRCNNPEDSQLHGNEPSSFIKYGEFHLLLSDFQLLKKDSASWS
jgi:hypothetical protein